MSMRSSAEQGLEAVLRLAGLYGGVTVRTIYEIIRLFNGHPAVGRSADEFYALGMAGKFFDDARDVVEDYATGSPNILLAMLTENAAERACILQRLRLGEPVGMRWVKENCPETH